MKTSRVPPASCFRPGRVALVRLVSPPQTPNYHTEEFGIKTLSGLYYFVSQDFCPVQKNPAQDFAQRVFSSNSQHVFPVSSFPSTLQLQPQNFQNVPAIRTGEAGATWVGHASATSRDTSREQNLSPAGLCSRACRPTCGAWSANSRLARPVALPFALDLSTLRGRTAQMPASVWEEWKELTSVTLHGMPVSKRQSVFAALAASRTKVSTIFLGVMVDLDLAGAAGIHGLDSVLSVCDELLRRRQLTDAGLVHLAGLSGLRQLVLSKCERLTNAGLARLAALPQLQHLNLHGCPRLTNAGLVTVAGLQHLQHLDLSGCTGLTDAGLLHLIGLHRLQHLNLSRMNLTGVGLVHLAGLQQLQDLNLSGTRITGPGLVHMSGLYELRHLELSECYELLDAGMEHLADLHQLQHLNLGNGSRLTDAGLVHLAALHQLQHLDLSYTWITHAGLVHLTGLQHLQHLDLGGCRRIIANMGLVILSLAGLHQLKHLSLCGWQLTDDGLEHFVTLMHQLQHLNLRECNQLTDAGLVHLAAMHQLQYLNLRDCRQLTDAGLVHLARLQRLKHLDLTVCDRGALADYLAGSRFTDAGLVHLAGLHQLEHLDLRGSMNLSNAGLVHLSGLRNLRHLDLSGCDGLTNAGLAYLDGLTTLQRLVHIIDLRWHSTARFRDFH
eukprot:g3107.t1